MSQHSSDDSIPSLVGRRQILAAGAFIGAGLATAARAADNQPDVSKPAAEGVPPPNRGSVLGGKVAVITGAARGIGRAIAWEMAANGADIIAVDICGRVSSASNAVPATADDLAATAKGIQSLGRQCKTVQADIRDISSLRAVAADTEKEFGKIDIVVANAAIQRWKPLLEMEDADWRDVIDNNLNGTANTVRATHQEWSSESKAASSSCPPCRASTEPRTPARIRRQNGESSG